MAPFAPTARLAELLVAKGLLDPATELRRADQLQTRCRRALHQWMQDRCGVLRILHLCVDVTVGNGVHWMVHTAQDDGQTLLRVCWFTPDAEVLVVGPTVERLESLYKGLGCTAVQVVGGAGWQIAPVFTYDDQLSILSQYAYGGEETLEDFISAYGIDEDEAAELRDRVLQPEEVHAETPAWALSPPRDRTLSDDDLRAIVRETTSPLAAQVAATILALRTCDVGSFTHLRDLLENGADFVGFGCFLRWSDRDYTLHVADTLFEYAYQGDCTDCLGMLQLDTADEAAFGQFLADMARYFNALALLDHLIYLLSGASFTSGATSEEAVCESS